QRQEFSIADGLNQPVFPVLRKPLLCHGYLLPRLSIHERGATGHLHGRIKVEALIHNVRLGGDGPEGIVVSLWSRTERIAGVGASKKADQISSLTVCQSKFS